MYFYYSRMPSRVSQRTLAMCAKSLLPSLNYSILDLAASSSTMDKNCDTCLSQSSPSLKQSDSSLAWIFSMAWVDDILYILSSSFHNSKSVPSPSTNSLVLASSESPRHKIIVDLLLAFAVTHSACLSAPTSGSAYDDRSAVSSGKITAFTRRRH